MEKVLNWYTQNKDYIDLSKDIVFVVGAVATFVGFYQFIKFLIERKILNKRQEMDNDARLYREIYSKLKAYVDSYEVTQEKLRDMGIRLLYIKNYPYKLDNDGFRQELFYYVFDAGHKANGYISGKGIYILNFLRYFDNCVYVNPKNGKWFIDEKGRSFRKYKALKYEHLLMRIPFANIFGYDFDSDWSDKGEPVFYTKYKYTDWRLFADDMEALTLKNGEYPYNRFSLRKSKRTRRIRSFFRKSKNKLKGYLYDRKIKKKLKEKHSTNQR